LFIVLCIISYMLEATTHPPRYGPPSRGITSRDVELAADALLRTGERPTIEKIREKIGRGSPNTINPMLDAWWKRLSARLDAGPPALHRLPESVAHVAEALWMQALDEGRRRAEQESARDARKAAETKSDLEVRSHVLTLREGELETRLKDRERQQATLETQLQELTTLLRREQSTRDAQARRISTLETQLAGQMKSRPLTTTRSVGERPLGRHRAARGVRHNVRNNTTRRRQSQAKPKRAVKLRHVAGTRVRRNTAAKKPSPRKRRR
jgi:hypothetical protein